MTDFLDIKPLTKEAFASFGDVIETTPSSMRHINGGQTERHHALAAPEAAGEGARVILNIFRGQPRVFPHEIEMMERHPLGSQSFSPLSGRPFLVVVADDDGGRPGRPQVFLARGDQGVNYRRNVWHYPLMPLQAVSDFLVADRDGPGNNLEEYFFDEPYMIAEPKP
ncbi:MULTISPECIES: ureidoglycolate lyase [Agrobacterium]|uniref:Ureidoglycolate lyase n=1 Tax=Agrobacterium salinitolerans TaxID=1183413 RepID=A0A1S9F5M3_9HYPH|nr:MULTISPECIES: ureidoglycolate lyase [Agrobacterium]MBA4775600.1 ureidoglycolate lyase [Hyphomicrobiales bacterium]PNQ26386.1 ureidoglycolate lyase [Rhizobium sp. YIC5082]MCZ7851487.1 ureidoglycolate lyase [Agrobacterium salinitolerans]MCZ7856768.1 ureidoglycolate lyase [Agrobacterium salinitolerans]MCZ7863180.1 ureidoglycolate lyase [Agrobacterium salinitolerans]